MVGDMAATWATLAVLAAISVTFFVYLGTKIDALGTKIDAQGAELGSRIDALAARLDARFASLAGRLDDHIGGHRHTG